MASISFSPPAPPSMQPGKRCLSRLNMILHPHAPEQQDDPQYYDRYRYGTAR